MFTDPVKNLKALGLRENNIVADLGAGTGYYSIIAGGMVPQGKVYAVEVQKDFLGMIQHKVQDAHLNNVECLWGNVEEIGGTKIGDDVVDAVIASNVFFQLDNKEKFIDEIKRILKKGGHVLFVDWMESPLIGSKNLVKRVKARDMFEKKGFVWNRDIDAGAHHYGMILNKK